ncbi:uncharacterized protein LOC121421253 [Lytechinus variegatus]|uniref:uncharacterized protein LOC121421253 n=1 Tax=Lytechinus variegatus TaxID=7654 RepID=UPI001BB25C38|nr:uncharacterized protein LOC121421253 [Lytechinus variegatus]
MSLTEDIQLQAAGDSILNIHGTADIDISIEDKTFRWNVFVADISDEGLLGFDFIHHFNFVLEPRRGLLLNDRLFRFQIVGDHVSCSVTAKSNIVSPANSEVIIARCSDTSKLDTEELPYGLIEPMGDRETLEPIQEASRLVDISRKDIDSPVRVANALDKDHVHAGKNIANLQQGDDVHGKCMDEVFPLPVKVVKSSSASDTLVFEGARPTEKLSVSTQTQTASAKEGAPYVKNLSCIKWLAAVVVVVVVALAAGVSRVLSRYRVMFGSMLMCLIGVVAVRWNNVSVARVKDGAARSLNWRFRPILRRLMRASSVSKQQKKTKVDKHIISVNQGVIVGNLAHEELLKIQRDDPGVSIVLDWLTKSRQTYPRKDATANSACHELQVRNTNREH